MEIINEIILLKNINTTLTGEQAMKAGTRKFSLYITDDTGEFTIEPVAKSTESRSWSTFRFFIRDYRRKLGDSLRPAVFAGAPDGFGTGKETAVRKGISMEFTYKTANLYVYTGTVPLTEAVI